MLIGLLPLLIGCSSVKSRTNLISRGSISSEPLKIITRPSEIGVGKLKKVKGSAISKKVLGFISVGGDNVANVGILNLGNPAKSSLERLASYRAVNENDMDGIYLTSARTEVNEIFFGLYKEEKTEVAGHGFKLLDLGEVSQQRGDIIRETGMIQNSEEKSILSKMFGWLWFVE